MITNYDEWAENLTPALAVEIARKRFMASLQWTLGLAPLLMSGVIAMAVLPKLGLRWGLIVASIISLHAVHVPYWFVGIMNWHYVFESAPLWLLLLAATTRELLSDWRARGLWGMAIWWKGSIALALLHGLGSLGTVLVPQHDPSRSG